MPLSQGPVGFWYEYGYNKKDWWIPLLSAIVLAAEEAPAVLIFPNWVFPLIAASVFTVLAFVVWSFRDVANRHSHKTDRSAAHGHTTEH